MSDELFYQVVCICASTCIIAFGCQLIVHVLVDFVQILFCKVFKIELVYRNDWGMFTSKKKTMAKYELVKRGIKNANS